MDIPYIDLVEQHRQLKTEILEAIERVLTHGHFILGPELEELENSLASYLNVPEVVGVSSGTDALILSLRLRNIGPGDEVITVSHSFVATASAIKLVGATPVFVDVEEETMLMNPALLKKVVTPRTRAVMPVHLNGYPCNMDPIVDFCREHDLTLIEDCAQAIGASYKGKSVGSFGIGAFSLHPLKVLSACGDAGFITVQNKEDAEQLRRLRNLGLINRDNCGYISSNSRLDTMHAAILLVKMKHLNQWIKARRMHAQAYRTAFAGKVMLAKEDASCKGVYSAFVIRHLERDRLLAELHRRGIDAKVHYPLAIHQHDAFTHFKALSLPVTEKIVSEIFSLPVTPELSESGRKQVITGLQEGLKEIEGE